MLKDLINLHKYLELYSKSSFANKVSGLIKKAAPPPNKNLGPITVPGDTRTYRWDEATSKFYVVTSTDPKEQIRIKNEKELPIEANSELYNYVLKGGEGEGMVEARAAASRRSSPRSQNRGTSTGGRGSSGVQSQQLTPAEPPVAGSPSTNKLSEAGKNFIKKEEGFMAKAYPDPPRVSIAYGNTYYPPAYVAKRPDLQSRPKKSDGTVEVKMGDSIAGISQADLTLFFDTVAANYERAVSESVTQPISQNQFDALVSLAYNIGVTALKNSNLLKMINKNPSDPAIRNEFLKNNKSGKGLSSAVVGNLTRRRAKEARIYFENQY